MFNLILFVLNVKFVKYKSSKKLMHEPIRLKPTKLELKFADLIGS